MSHRVPVLVLSEISSIPYLSESPGMLHRLLGDEVMTTALGDDSHLLAGLQIELLSDILRYQPHLELRREIVVVLICLPKKVSIPT